MGVLSSMSESGYKAKQVAAAIARARNKPINPSPPAGSPSFRWSSYSDAHENEAINGVFYKQMESTDGKTYYKDPLKPGTGWIPEDEINKTPAEDWGWDMTNQEKLQTSNSTKKDKKDLPIRGSK
jgi:hypothetical protein